MAKTCVSLKCNITDIFDSGLKSGVAAAMESAITDAIDSKSGGKLEVKGKCTEGFLLTASLSLKADDKDKPTKLDAKISMTVIAVGSTAKAFTGNSSGSSDGIGSKVQNAANDLVTAILEDFMPKVVKTILSL